MTASPRDRGLSFVARQDLGQPVDQRTLVLAGAAGVELGAEDLGAALHQPAQEREVLALGQALVAPGPQIVQVRASMLSTYAGSRIRSMRRWPVFCSFTSPILRSGPAQQTASSVWYGSTAPPPPGWYSKWRWFTLVSPVEPTYPITCPAPTWPDAPYELMCA